MRTSSSVSTKGSPTSATLRALSTRPTYDDGDWDETFRERWAAIVGDAGRAVADPDAEVAPIHARLDELSAEPLPDGEERRGRAWPLYGALITSVRHIAVIVDDVASARRARDAEESPTESAHV